MSIVVGPGGSGSMTTNPSADQAQEAQYLTGDPHSFDAFSGQTLLDVVHYTIQNLHTRVKKLESQTVSLNTTKLL